MPLALVLQDTFGTWRRDVSKLSGWNQLVDLEQVLLDRARGAFLARWFGTGLPIYTGYLRVAIANIDALAKRYQELRREAKREGSDLNLTEPLAGITGTMIGALLSPTSSMVLMAVISEQMPKWYTTLAASLNWLTFGALGMLLFTVGVPVLAIGLPLGAIAHQDSLGVVHDFLGALAGVFVSARVFLEQLLGPRKEVKNPLLAGILNTLDGLARLLPLIFALVAFIITEVGPVLTPLATQIDIMITLAQDMFLIIKNVLDDLFEKLQALYIGKHSPWATLQSIIWTFRQLFRTIKDEFSKLFKSAGRATEQVPVMEKGKPTGKTEARAWAAIQRTLVDAFDKVLPFIKQLTTESWLVKRIKAIGERFGKIADIFGGLNKHPQPKESSVIKEHFIGGITGAVPPLPASLKTPTLPSIPVFPIASETFLKEEWKSRMSWKPPSMISVFEKPDGGYVFTLDSDAQQALKKLRRPPFDVFAADRKTLLEGKKREELFDDAMKAEAQLRTLLFEVIDRMLPAGVAAEVPKLQGLLWELDAALYGEKALFPVRDLPGGDRLSVKVDKVRIHAVGKKEKAVRDWGKDLKTALEKQIYRTDRTISALS